MCSSTGAATRWWGASPWTRSAWTSAPTGECKVGDTVTLIGADGDERITVEEIAQQVGTINYEITCDIALDRSERLFLNEEHVAGR